jgi:hypothetical protein
MLFLNVTAQVSHPYKTNGRIMVLYILTFTTQTASGRQKALVRMVASIPRI